MGFWFRSTGFWGVCRLMLELKKAQVEQYVQKVTGMAQAAGCKVTLGSGDGSVVRVPDSSSKFRGFESQQERWANFLSQDVLSC